VTGTLAVPAPPVAAGDRVPATGDDIVPPTGA
jgi:hypothetical protein